MRRQRVGFTLVELLVVITIIGILIALLLPAAQAAREAGRRAKCSNNIKQITLGALQHAETHKFLPSGGWGWAWTGDPDLGFGKTQPGGWAYDVLPYIDQVNLHRLGANEPEAKKKQLLAQVAATPLALFICPTRRRVIVYPFVHGTQYAFINRPTGAGRSDYAANAGSADPGEEYGPSTHAAAKTHDWQYANIHNGVVFQRSEINFEHIRDGASNTYLIGERYLNPDHYYTGKDHDDDQCLYLGHDRDVARWTTTKPMRDRPGLSNYWAFGSTHSGTFNMSFCDGSVRGMTFSIDPAVHVLLGSRADGVPTDASMY